MIKEPYRVNTLVITEGTSLQANTEYRISKTFQEKVGGVCCFGLSVVQFKSVRLISPEIYSLIEN